MMPNNYNNGPPPIMHPQRRQNQHEYYNSGYYGQPQYHPQHAYQPQWGYPQYPMPPHYTRPYHMNHMPPQPPMQHSPMIVSSTPQPASVPQQMRPPPVASSSSAATPPSYPMTASPTPSNVPQPIIPLRGSADAPDTTDLVSEEPVAEPPSGRRTPWYPQLPWYSAPQSEFPPRAPRRRRKVKQQTFDEALQLPLRQEPESRDEDVSVSIEPDASIAESSTFDQDESSVKEVETTQTTPLPPATPDQSPNPKIETPLANKRPVVPALPVAPRPSTAQTSSPTSAPEIVVSTDEKTEGEQEDPTPAPKAVPKSWADLVRSKASPVATEQIASGAPTSSPIVVGTSKSGPLADVLRSFAVSSGAKFSFLEPRGLVNTGNMCYMNSVLQVLLYCIPFHEFLDLVGKRASHSFHSDTPLLDAMIMFMREFKVIDSAESVEKLKMRLKDHELEQYGEALVPEYVYEAIKRNPRFSNMRRGHQQDAEEFLGILLEVLHEECESVMSKSATDSDQTASPVSDRSASGDSGWLEVGPKQRAAITRSSGHAGADSPISKIFGGKLRSELRVSGMKNSVTLEAYRPLQLDIGAPNVHNIVDALKGLTRSETLQGDFNSPRGPGIPAHKQVFIETLPPVLILHLKRFQYDNTGGAQKIWKKIGYPLELEIPKEVFSQQKRAALTISGLPKYKLSAVVYHHGNNASGGHYTVDVRRQDGIEWIRLNDTVIRRLRTEDVAAAGAEEDPRILAKALEQHKRELSAGTANPPKSGNFYDSIEEHPEQGKGWKQVNGSFGGKDLAPAPKKPWNTVVNGNTPAAGATSPSSAGKSTPKNKDKDGLKENKVAYLLFYRKVD